MELNNKNAYLLQTRISFCCESGQLSFSKKKLGQTLLQIGTASLLQIGAYAVTNWGNYYKLGQPLLQNRTAITNWAKFIINWGITSASSFLSFDANVAVFLSSI